MTDPRATRVLLAVLSVAVGALLAGRDLAEPGLYYDEVIQVHPALAFLAEDGRPSQIPGVHSVRLLGGWFPWMTQPYMGALKSQLLIPVFAVADPDVALLRATTLAWALAGIAFAVLWVHPLFGPLPALLTGLLLATDPSVLFVARHDWGSFSLGLLLRAAALWLLFEAARSRSPVRAALGGACLGLGVYNKIDFAVFVAAAGLAVAAVAPSWIRAALTARRREAGLALAGLAVGAAPMAIAAGGALAAAGAASAAQGLSVGDWTEKLRVAASVLDGSYFQRLLLAGGSFEQLLAVEGAVASPALAALALAAAGLVWLAWRRRDAAADGPPPAALRFVLATTALTLLGLLLTPRAVRIHHYLNATPFPQLVVALAIAELARRGGRPGRIGAVAAAALVLGGNLRVDLATLDTVREGGRGRWSDAVARFERDLGPDARLVSLDWGFDGPLRFLAPARSTREPVWHLRRAHPRRGLRLSGDARDVYLLYEPAYAVFPYGEALLEAVEGLPEGAARVASHADRGGRPVFRSVRFSGPHELVYRGGRFQVRLR